MMIYDIFKKVNRKNNYLVISNELKSRIIKQKSDYETSFKTLLDFKIITENELIDLFSFSVDNEAYFYNLENNNLELSQTKEMFLFSKYNLNKNNVELNEFIKLNSKFININELFLNTIKDYNFYLLCNEVYLKPFFKFYNLSYENVTFNSINNPIVHKFLSKEEEMFYLFESISKLLKNGTDINNIYLSNIDSSYETILLKLSKFYKIPIERELNIPLINIPYINKLFKFNYKKIIKVLTDIDYKNEIFNEEIRVDQESFDENIKKVISIFNKYPYERYNNETTLQVIIEDLKNTYIEQPKLKNTISIVSLDEIVGLNESDIVFILNTVYESFPKISKDNDFLSDSDKTIINYPTSSMVNVSRNKYLEEIIKLPNIKYLSFSLKDKESEYTASDIIQKRLDRDKKATIIKEDDLMYGFAKGYYKSVFSKEKSDHLLTDFTGEFKLTSIEHKELTEYINKYNIKISPSQITKYFNIPFIYYLDKVLGVSIFNENISQRLGNFFHSAIEILLMIFFESKIDRSRKTSDGKFSKDEDIHKMIFDYIIKKDEENLTFIEKFDFSLYFDEFFNIYFCKVNEALSKINNDFDNQDDDTKLWIKTIFYIKKNKKIIIKAFYTIINMEIEMPSNEIIVEGSIDYENFTGKADLIKVSSDNKYTIIDYKTGKKPSYTTEKIVTLVQTLLLDNNDELVIADIDLLQLVFYAYFFYKIEDKLSLKSFAYYSYFDPKLNALGTEELNKDFYTAGKNRIINDDELVSLFSDIELLLNKTMSKINSFHFPVEIRKDIKSKEGLNKKHYAIYDAHAFFNDNILNDGDDEEEEMEDNND